MTRFEGRLTWTRRYPHDGLVPAGDPTPGPYSGLDLFVGAGPSLERCVAAIGGVLGLARDQFVGSEDLDALVTAIRKATVGWVVCHRSDHSDYPHRFDINLIDGRAPVDALPNILRMLRVGIVVPDEGTDDPYAGLRFDPDGTVEPFSLLAFDD